jgi:thymidine kinase
MSKLYYRYGAMNSGKSTAMLQVAHNYEERNQAVLIAKPAIDTKEHDNVSSRLGVNRKVDILLKRSDSLTNVFMQKAEEVKRRDNKPISCLLIDEAQFLTRHQVEEAFELAVLHDVPVLAYGIRTDFLTNGFEGSLRLFELAHSLEELKTICRCGRKALFNARRVAEDFVFEGGQVAIDGDSVTYESLCGLCYLTERDSKAM